MEDFSIGLDRDAALPAIPDSNATFCGLTNVVISCVEPLNRMFVESCDEDRFLSSLLGIKFVAP